MKKGMKSKLLAMCVLVLLCGNQAVLGITNDNCANAKPVGNVTNLAFNTTNATFDGPGHYMRGPNLWYCYTAPCTGCATVSLLGSEYDTKLAVYEGCECYPNSTDLIKVSDDYAGRQSQLSFPVTAGNQYLIEVGGYGSRTGQGVLTITCDTNVYPPDNDDCQSAESVGNVTDLPFDTTCATFDGPGRCEVSSNIWYRYTAAGSGEVTVSLLGSEYDTSLAVYSRASCYPRSDDMIECNDDFEGHVESQIAFQATAGREYLIEVGGYNVDESGPGIISISSEFEPPLSNDNCTNARKVGDVINLPFDTREATFDGPGHCMGSPNLWYHYTASCTGQAAISLCGSSFDTMLAIYRGWECYPKSSDLMGCNDDVCGRQSELRVNVIAGNQYLIEVGGYGNETGQGVLSVSCEGEQPAEQYDLGDAPDSTNNFGKVMSAYPHQGLLPVVVHANYPTVFDDGSDSGPYGPVHMRPGAVAYLGEMVTWETEADHGPDQDGVNNIRPSINSPDNDRQDDGVVFPVNLPSCRWAAFDYVVQVIEPGTDLWVNVWCDWNRDGDWDDTSNCTLGPAPEWAVQNQLLFNLSEGVHQITTPAILAWHPKNGPEEMWMRITLSEKPWKGGSHPGEPGNGGSGPLSKYDIGETEDYYFVPDMSRPICEDFNGDGVINTQDLIDLTAVWLSTCPE